MDIVPFEPQHQAACEAIIELPHSGPPKLEGYRSGFLAFADPGQTVKETLSDSLDEGKLEIGG